MDEGSWVLALALETGFGAKPTKRSGYVPTGYNQ